MLGHGLVDEIEHVHWRRFALELACARPPKNIAAKHECYLVSLLLGI